jgi:hypothetical protein
MERAGYINGILGRSGQYVLGEMTMTVGKPIRRTGRAGDTWTRGDDTWTRR